MNQLSAQSHSSQEPPPSVTSTSTTATNATATTKTAKKRNPRAKKPSGAAASTGSSGFTQILRTISQTIHLYKAPERSYYAINFVSIVKLCSNFQEIMSTQHLPREIGNAPCCIFAGTLAWAFLARFTSLAQHLQTADPFGSQYEPGEVDLQLPSFLMSIVESFGEFVDRENAVVIVPYITTGVLSRLFAFALRCFTVSPNQADTQGIFEYDRHSDAAVSMYGSEHAYSAALKSAALRLKVPTPESPLQFVVLAFSSMMHAGVIPDGNDILQSLPEGYAQQPDLTTFLIKATMQYYQKWIGRGSVVTHGDLEGWIKDERTTGEVFPMLSNEMRQVLEEERAPYVAGDPTLINIPDFGTVATRIPLRAIPLFRATQAWMTKKMTCKQSAGGYGGSSTPVIINLEEGSKTTLASATKFTTEEAVQAILLDNDSAVFLTEEKEVMNFNHRLQQQLPHTTVSLPYTTLSVFASCISQSLL